jgi:hypothetical protein
MPIASRGRCACEADEFVLGLAGAGRPGARRHDVGESKLAVDVSWLQVGGVVLLKIVTAGP